MKKEVIKQQAIEDEVKEVRQPQTNKKSNQIVE